MSEPTEESFDFWNRDSFIHEVTSALIAAYETRIDPECSYHNHRGLGSITESDLYMVRRHGFIIPAPGRVVWSDHFDNSCGTPKSACMAWGSHRPASDDMLQSYCMITFCRQLDRFPTGIRRTALGSPYEMIDLYPQDNGIVTGLRSHLVLKPNGGTRLQECAWNTPHKSDPENEKREMGLTATLQFQEDMQNQWTVTAETDVTRVTVGAYPESIKSVLYARSLPLTASGRKRPILHLVDAHRRRVASGIQIDIDEFLRGTRLVEMDGIRFRVSPAKKLEDRLQCARRSKKA